MFDHKNNYKLFSNYIINLNIPNLIFNHNFKLSKKYYLKTEKTMKVSKKCLCLCKIKNIGKR